MQIDGGRVNWIRQWNGHGRRIETGGESSPWRARWILSVI